MKRYMSVAMLGMGLVSGCVPLVEYSTYLDDQYSRTWGLYVAPEVAFVAGRSPLSDFPQDERPTRPPADIMALEGCWGASASADMLLTSASPWANYPDEVHAEFYRFELTRSRIIWQCYQRNYAGLLTPSASFVEEEYAVEIVAPNTIVATPIRRGFAAVFPDEDVPFEETEIPEDRRPSLTMRVALEGDLVRFLAGDGLAAGLGPFGEGFVFHRLDCSVVGGSAATPD